MKKIIFPVLLSLLTLGSWGQSEKYFTAMKTLVVEMDTTRSIEGLTTLANSFERIANAEKSQWLPFYYAALCNINIGNIYFQARKPELIDPQMDKAEPLLQAAESLEKNNSELFLLRKMFNTGKMMADPMTRYMTFGTQASQALETARTLNKENPRVYLMEGIDKYYTPEQFGGSKTEGKKMFEEADRLFGTFKPATDIDPNWGRPMVKYFLAEASK